MILLVRTIASLALAAALFAEAILVVGVFEVAVGAMLLI